MRKWIGFAVDALAGKPGHEVTLEQALLSRLRQVAVVIAWHSHAGRHLWVIDAEQPGCRGKFALKGEGRGVSGENEMIWPPLFQLLNQNSDHAGRVPEAIATPQ